MVPNEDEEEEELLRSVALQNAQSILLARQRAEEALREQSEWLRVTLSSIGDAVISTDAEGLVTFLNPVAESLTGWTNGEAARQRLDAVFRIVNEQTRQTVANPATRALREGVIVGVANHTILIAKDGTERSIDDSAAPIRSQAGEVVGSVLTFRDITERRRTERALEQSEARKTAMFEAALDCIISCDHEGTIIEFNAAAEHTFGYRREEVLGRELAAVIIPPAFRAPHRKGLARYLVTGEGPILNQRLELSALRADGAEFPVELTVTRIPVSGPPIFTAYLRDITDRKRIEESLRTSEERYRSLAQATTSVVWTTDTEGRFVTEQPSWSTYTGQTWEELRDFGWANAVHPDDRERVRSLWEAARAARTLYKSHGRLWHAASRSYRHFEARGVRVLNSDGSVREWVGECLDVEERKQAEVALREADRRKNEFLGILAHELRNPLAPISNAVQILQRGDAKAVASASEMMERQVGQMVRLVDDLLDVSRISGGKIELRKGRIELASAVNHAAEAARALYQGMNHELTVTLPPQPIYLNADPIRLAQIVGNLLNNACKFTDKGGRISLIVEREGEQAVIRVRDTGIGIAAAQLPRIFEMFTQVDTSLERSVSGLGIGLTLVKNLVGMHDGTVEVYSPGIGQGSEFVVRLPITVETAEPPLKLTVSEPTTTTARRILVVDDNRDSATSLSNLLKLTGNETHTAYDGLEAVEAAATFKPDVVLLDIGLPRLNGYEACRRIREQPWGRGIILVALTGWGQKEDRQRSREAGFNAHMVKPVVLDALTKLLASLSPEDR